MPRCSVIEKVVPFEPGRFIELRIADPIPPGLGCDIEHFAINDDGGLVEGLGFRKDPLITLEARSVWSDIVPHLTLIVARAAGEPIWIPLAQCDPRAEEVSQFGHRLRIETSPILDRLEQRGAARYGTFVFSVHVDDSLQSGETVSGPVKSLCVNRVYYEEFASIERAFTSGSRKGLALSPAVADSESDGVRISNESRSKGFVSALLMSRFQFYAPMIVAGTFSISYGGSAPAPRQSGMCPAVDVTFGSSPHVRQGDVLQVIMGDSSLDSYCMKLKSEGVVPIRMPADLYRHLNYEYVVKNKRSLGNSLRDSQRAMRVAETRDDPTQPENHFQIRFEPCPEDRRQVWCSVFVAATSDLDYLQPNEDALAHRRLIPRALFQDGDLRIRIRVWRAGEVVVHRLVVAQIAPDGHSGADASGL
jgi:hypothetical protein